MNAAVIVMVGAKGGCGTTSLTVDLAQHLQRTGSVAVVDGDLTGRRSVAVITDSIRALDAARQSASISVAKASNAMTLVEMTSSLDAGFTIQLPAVEELATLVCDSATNVLVDAPQPFAGAVRAFVVRAAKFLIVAEANILGVTGARNMQIELTRFGIPRGSIGFVLNQRGMRSELSRAEFERAVGGDVVSEIPLQSDRRHRRAVEQLAATVASIPPSTSLLQPGPSARTPVGDRRGGGGRRIDAVVPGQTPEERAAGTAIAREKREARDKLKTEVHAALSDTLDMLAASRASNAQRLAELRAQVGGVVSELLQGRSDLGSAEEIAVLRQEIVDEALGYGPIEDLLRDPDVSEIMVNGCKFIYVERNGKIERTQKRFAGDRQLRLVIERMIAPIGRRIDESTPMVDARLEDGSRVNAVIEPLAIDGPTLTIRRFGHRRLQIVDLLRLGAVTEPIVDFLRAAVEARLNIVISGGTGSGKTTFLNILSGFIPNDERIVTIEDAAELHLAQEHIVRLESRPANLEGTGEVAIRDLVRNALRMRPDRIIVGECRSGEALDMLQAMNTGHDGSLTTIHANAPRDALARIETMVMMAGFDLPIKAIREQVSGAIDMVIQTSRLRDGTRKVMSICEVVGMEGDVVTMHEVVRFHQQGLDKQGKVLGEFVFTGVQPYCLQRFEETGINFDVRSLSMLTTSTKTW